MATVAVKLSRKKSGSTEIISHPNERSSQDAN
jgi:hypothetical protein